MFTHFEILSFQRDIDFTAMLGYQLNIVLGMKVPGPKTQTIAYYRGVVEDIEDITIQVLETTVLFILKCKCREFEEYKKAS